MTIASGSTASAVDINSIVLKSGFMTQANIQKSTLTFGAGEISLISGSQDYLVDGFRTYLTHDTSNTTLVVDNLESIIPTYNASKYVSYKAYIANKQSLVLANTWTTSGTVSGGATLTLTTSGVALSDGVSGIDFYANGADSEFIIHWRVNASVTGQTVNLQLSDGSNHISMLQRYCVTPATTDWQDTIKVKIDYSAQQAFVSLNGGAFGAAIDISSAGGSGGGNWYIRIINAAASISTVVYLIGYVLGDSSTEDYVGETKTFNATKSAGILTWDTDSQNTITGYLSANSGSNYATAVKDTWTTIGTPGTVGKLKLTCSTPASIDATSSVSDIKEINMVGAYFDG